MLANGDEKKAAGVDAGERTQVKVVAGGGDGEINLGESLFGRKSCLDEEVALTKLEHKEDGDDGDENKLEDDSEKELKLEVVEEMKLADVEDDEFKAVDVVPRRLIVRKTQNTSKFKLGKSLKKSAVATAGGASLLHVRDRRSGGGEPSADDAADDGK